MVTLADLAFSNKKSIWNSNFLYYKRGCLVMLF